MRVVRAVFPLAGFFGPFDDSIVSAVYDNAEEVV
jgi:hypothetical protein